MPASAIAKRQECITDCAVHFLDFASDALSPVELCVDNSNLRTRNTAAYKKGDMDYNID